MLSELVKARIRQSMVRVGLALASLGLTPNLLTALGLVLNGAVAVILASGLETLGGVILLPVAAFDMLDGAVARATNRSTRFGAFLDSTLDRYAEALVFLGILYAYSSQANPLTNTAIMLAIVGSLMVSYTRARAEGLGLRCEVGLLPRPERIIILSLGLIVGWTVPAVWFLAVLTNFTAAQRMWHVWTVTKGE